MWIRALAGVVVAGAVQLGGAPVAGASAPGLCDQIGGQWNGQYCHASVASDRRAVREINIAIPAEVDDPVIGAASPTT